MKINFAMLGLIPALSLTAATANAAVIVHIDDTANTAQRYFSTTDAAPDFSSVDASFSATISGRNTPFDFVFQFTLPLTGIGSGSLSTSFSNRRNALTISEVIIDGTTYVVAPGVLGQSLLVSSFPIVQFKTNSIEVIGITGSRARAGTFAGTASFAAPTVPEPATWATFVLGFGFLGSSLRRKGSTKLKIA